MVIRPLCLILITLGFLPRIFRLFSELFYNEYTSQVTLIRQKYKYVFFVEKNIQELSTPKQPHIILPCNC